MKVHLLSAMLVLPLLLTHASADEPSELATILYAQGWNGSDCFGDCIDDLKRQRWLALVAGKSGWTLVPSRLSFDHVETTGIRSSVDHAEFYLSHPSLVVGHAETPNLRFKGQPRQFHAGDVAPLAFSFHDRRYDVALEDHRLFLRTTDRKSPLGEVGGDDDESVVALAWAGDLDGDGEIDAIIDKTNTKNGQLCLLLSSVNKDPHALVSEVGCQFFSG